MKNLPKEFILTDFTREEGDEVLQHYKLDGRLFNMWEYLIIEENDYDVTDDEYFLPEYPRLSYQQWKEIVSPNVQEPFPEKWYIDVTSENRDVLNKWRHDNHSVSSDQFFKTGNGARLYSHDVSGDMVYFDISPLREYSQYVEITFEQFKKFVLKEAQPTPMQIDWDKVEQPLIAPVGIGKSLLTHFVKIVGNDLREIYENSNREGKLFLETRFANYNVFNNEFELSNVDVDFLRGTCNKEVVTKIFGEVIDFDTIEVGDYVTMKDGTVGNVVIYNNNWVIDVYKDFAKREDKKVTTIFVAKDGIYERYGQDYFQTQLKSVSKK